ncbi:MAG: F0F1 ATP synthase subunit delta [Desulfobacteraceae bacterium 4572_35.1]|nr:MAG: F0F1 ATP synthase subunit delta [Desulfobacteraceae bacterium 4572_35.1]
MSSSAISKRYAQALVELATEKKMVEQYGAEIASIEQLLARENALRQLMESPTVDVKKKAAVMADIVAAMELSPGVCNFVGLLTVKDRLRYIGQICSNYATLSDAISGVVRAKVVSAAKMTKAQVDSIQKGLESQTGKKVSLQVQVDSSLLGGVKAEVGGKVFDGSIKTQLQRIEDTLKKG